MLARALALTTLVMFSSSSLAFVAPAFRATARSTGAMRMMAAAADGKVDVAIVTGGSRGIGKACALELARYGVKVVVNYASSAESALAVVEEIKALGSEAVAIKVGDGVIFGGRSAGWGGTFSSLSFDLSISFSPPLSPLLSSFLGRYVQARRGGGPVQGDRRGLQGPRVHPRQQRRHH